MTGIRVIALIALIAVFAGLTAPLAAHERMLPAEIRSVHDGDTFRADLELGLGLIQPDEPMRLDSVDTPERGWRAQCEHERQLAEAARDRLLALLASGPVVIEERGRDRYGRLLVRAWAGGVDVATVLIEEGLGRAYDGGKREGWC